MGIKRYDAIVEYGAPTVEESDTGDYVEYDDYASLDSIKNELLEALQMALEWIDAVPSDTLLPAMPGFDRDEVNSIINKALGETK